MFRSALVTGGASGIGRGVVELLVQCGASVAIVDRDRDAMAVTMEGLGPTADVAASFQAAIERSSQAWSDALSVHCEAGAAGETGAKARSVAIDKTDNMRAGIPICPTPAQRQYE